MFIPHGGPGTWQSFLKRKDNVGLPIMEARQKYLKEQLLFESYINTLNTVSTVSTAAAGAAGGPAAGGGSPSPGPTPPPPDPYPDWDIVFTIDTNYSLLNYGAGRILPSTKVNFTNSTFTLSSGVFIYPTTTPQGAVTVDWGDGTPEETLSNFNYFWDGDWATFSHDYATDGQYQIKIKGPGASYVRFNLLPIISLDKFIYENHSDLRALFASMPTTGVQIPLDNWVVSGDITSMFGDAFPQSVGNGYLTVAMGGINASLNNWDVSGVTNIIDLFKGNQNLRSDLSNWNLSNVTRLLGVFTSAGSATVNSTGFGNWSLPQVTALDDVYTWYYFLWNTDPSPYPPPYVTQLWNGWKFSSTPGGGNWFSYMLDRARLDSSDVIKNWVISMANDPNTPNNGTLNGNAIGNVLIGSAASTVAISTLNLTADAAFNTAVSTLQGKGWTISNF